MLTIRTFNLHAILYNPTLRWAKIIGLFKALIVVYVTTFLLSNSFLFKRLYYATHDWLYCVQILHSHLINRVELELNLVKKDLYFLSIPFVLTRLHIHAHDECHYSDRTNKTTSHLRLKMLPATDSNFRILKPSIKFSLDNYNQQKRSKTICEFYLYHLPTTACVNVHM